jgi:hypothetical protein
LIALANSVDPGGVELVEASVAVFGAHSETLADALHADDRVSWIADTGIAVPD